MPEAFWCPVCCYLSNYDETGDHEDAEGWCHGVMAARTVLTGRESLAELRDVLEAVGWTVMGGRNDDRLIVEGSA